jgi:hypothetical protein
LSGPERRDLIVAVLSTSDLSRAGCSADQVSNTEAAIAAYHSRQATDGLPVVPATFALVDDMMSTTTAAADDVIGQLPLRKTRLTVLQVAICAVLAGAEPKHFPIILTSWRAMFEPEFNLNGALSSSGGSSLTGIVSGPGAQIAEMNSCGSLLGPGNRANASIGRAIRLTAITAFRARPGELDASSFGHAGKYTSHFAEADPPEQVGAAWTPLRVREGFATDCTTVTMLPTEAPRQISHLDAGDPRFLIRKIAAAMADLSQTGAGRSTNYLIVLGPEHQHQLRHHRIEVDEFTDLVAVGSQIPPGRLAEFGATVADGGYIVDDHTGNLVTVTPEQLCVVTAGGPGAGWSLVIPGWGTALHTHRITRELEG